MDYLFRVPKFPALVDLGDRLMYASKPGAVREARVSVYRLFDHAAEALEPAHWHLTTRKGSPNE